MECVRNAMKIIRKDPVLVISFVLALLSMLVVPPSSAYADYIDVRTLAILLCLMAVVSGISSTGAFRLLAVRVLSCCHGLKAACAVLVALPFFLSMLITNDVALITFVPFAILVLGMAGRKDLVIPVLVLQTVAANLGSMLLPFGNPQNIFIASKYGLGIGDFILTAGPFVVAGFILLAVMTSRIGGGSADVDLSESTVGLDARRLSVFILLFALCVCAVLRIIPYEYVLLAILVIMVLVSPRTLLNVDWGLLLTFVFLFVFTGNLASVDAVRDAMDGFMSWNPVAASALVSQFISNVPAAVMLSNFTSDWGGLLSGVNIGGFGTPIASMASIITLRIYSKEEYAKKSAFLRTFLVINAVFLAALLVLGCIL